MKVYVASSWRNQQQPAVVRRLRAEGHEVYDFKHPDNAFHWGEIDRNWMHWSTYEYRQALSHPLAVAGFKSDFAAMEWADAFVLVLPCGRSAHLELGWACGKGKRTLILLDNAEPELMTKIVDHICLTIKEVIDVLNDTRNRTKNRY